MLQRILNEVNTTVTCECIRIDIKQATDDTYPEYRMDSTTGFQISSSSTPVHVPSGSKMGQEMGLPYRRSAPNYGRSLLEHSFY